MSRPLPEIEIAGHAFTVDLRQDHIAAVKPNGALSPIYFSDMKGPEARRRFLLDTRTLGHYTPAPGDKKLPNHVVCVDIAHPALLDPQGFCRKHGVPESITPKAILAMQQEEPAATILERVKLGGHDYFIDRFGLAFLDGLDLHNRLFFMWFKNNDQGGLSLLYNKETRSIAGKSSGEDKKNWQSIDMPPIEKVMPNLEEIARKKKLVGEFINKVALTAAMQEVARRKKPRRQQVPDYLRKQGKNR